MTMFLTNPKRHKKRSRRMLDKYRVTLEQFKFIECGICHCPITDVKKLTVDHIIPRTKGGTSRQDNMQPAHKRCNNQKGDRILPL